MSLFDSLRRCVDEEVPVTQVTVISRDSPRFGSKMLVFPDGRNEGELGTQDLTELGTKAARSAEETGPATVQLPDAGGDIELFVEVFAPLPKLIVVGAVHVAVHLVYFAQRLGFHTVVLDARAAFATKERFPHADELVLDWPADALARIRLHDSTYLVFLTHDPKLDDPALAVALRSPARYVGALGSKRTHAKRIERLHELGLDEKQVARIHAPIGLDLGGRKPEEVALAIAAELVMARHGKARPGERDGA
ncbi:MAG TPA: XdhC family protein [Thermoanaerobaculia bacterium]|nr:XdhC family protein [Thermoanaerobaculia bacterium]